MEGQCDQQVQLLLNENPSRYSKFQNAKFVARAASRKCLAQSLTQARANIYTVRTWTTLQRVASKLETFKTKDHLHSLRCRGSQSREKLEVFEQDIRELASDPSLLQPQGATQRRHLEKLQIAHENEYQNQGAVDSVLKRLCQSEQAQRKLEVDFLQGVEGIRKSLVSYFGEYWNGCGSRELQAACSGGHYHFLSIFLEFGMDLSVSENVIGAFAAAIRTQNLETISQLATLGADIEARTPEGDTPLLLACRSSALNCAQLLISLGANIHASNNGGNTALHISVGKEHYELVSALISGGASPSVRNAMGQTVLDVIDLLEPPNPGLRKLVKGTPPTSKNSGS